MISIALIDLLEMFLECDLIIVEVFTWNFERVDGTLLEPDGLQNRIDREFPPLLRFKWLPRDGERSQLAESLEFILHT